LIDVLTAEHGRATGFVRGGGSRKQAPHLQPGTQLDLRWAARLEDHLGTFTAEPVRSRAGLALGDRLALAGLGAVCALTAWGLPERDAVPAFYARTVDLLDLMGATEAWPLAYAAWERALLDLLGVGLDLGSCAVTGATDGLAYVSPRTGRAVTVEGAGAWIDQLLPLPACLAGGTGDDRDVAQAMRTIGHFLARSEAAQARPIPAARARLEGLLAR
ncbi:MAG: DNA repair protein RecO, partial [Shimia sp.]